MATRIVRRPAVFEQRLTRRTPPAYSAKWTAILLASDVALFIAASGLGALIGFHHWNSPRILNHLLIAEVIYVALWVVTFDRLGLYRRTYALSMKDELYYTVAALMLGTVPQLVLFTLYPGISTSRIALLFGLLFSIVLVGSSRALYHDLRRKEWYATGRRVSIVGTAGDITRVLDSLDLPEHSQTLLIEVDDLTAAIEQIDLSRDPGLRRIEWFNHARTWGCESLILAGVVAAPPHLPLMLEVAAAERIHLAFAPPNAVRSCYDVSLQTDGRQVLIVPKRLRACSPRAQLLKRFMDVSLACIALALFAPIMVLAALAILIDSGPPIFYGQDRIGAGGRPFRIYKFRSMRQDAESRDGPVWATQSDPRKTRVGTFLRRFSIDELPQLFNVLQGDMSLVGPRPERPVFVDLFRSTMPRYDQRHLVRPGITGWSHVHMRRNVDTSAAGERLAYDLQYLENWSPYLDVAILFQTLCEFLFHRAA